MQRGNGATEGCAEIKNKGGSREKYSLVKCILVKCARGAA